VADDFAIGEVEEVMQLVSLHPNPAEMYRESSDLASGDNSFATPEDCMVINLSKNKNGCTDPAKSKNFITAPLRIVH
jgi:hypothetical protein